MPLGGYPRFRDVLSAVAVCALHGIDDKVLPYPEIRIDVFPDDFAFGRDLEEPAEPPLADQRVAVRQPLRVRQSRPEEVGDAELLKSPDDRLRRGAKSIVGTAPSREVISLGWLVTI